MVDCAVARLLFLCYREYLCRFSRVLAGVRGLGEEEVRGLYSGEPIIEVSRDGVGILSDTILRKIDCTGARGEKTISATLMSALEGCRASWVVGNLVFPEAIEEPADNPKRRGSLFHKVMEDFYRLEPGERNAQSLRETAVNVLDSDEFKDFHGNEAVLLWLDEAVRGYLNVDRDPRRVNIAEWTTDWGRTVPGLEVAVSWQPEGVKRKCFGFIDRLQEWHGRLFIEDYKTSRSAKRYRFNPSRPDADPDHGLAGARQQAFYAMMVERAERERGSNRPVHAARLIFPLADGGVSVKVEDVHDPGFREKVERDIRVTDARMDELHDSGFAGFEPGPLCAWCPLVKLCPAAAGVEARFSAEKFVKAREGQPEFADYGSAVVRGR